MVAKKTPGVKSGDTVQYTPAEGGGAQLATVTESTGEGQTLHLLNAPGMPTVTANYSTDGAPGTWREVDDAEVS